MDPTPDDLPDTSRKAREDNAPRADSQHHKMIQAIESEPAGLTRDGVRSKTGILTQSVVAGVNALVRDDWITDTHKLRPTSTGSAARVLVVTPKQWARRVLVEAVASLRERGESHRDALLRLGWVKVRDDYDAGLADDPADPRYSSILLSDAELGELEIVADWIAQARESAGQDGTPNYRQTYTVMSDALDGLRWLVSGEAVKKRAAQARARKRWAGLIFTPEGLAVRDKRDRPEGVFDGNDAAPDHR